MGGIARSGPARADLRKWNGVDLPAGPFTVRASSVQRGVITITGATGTGTASISSVTTTRVSEIHGGQRIDAETEKYQSTIELTAATTVTATQGADTAADASHAFRVPEFV